MNGNPREIEERYLVLSAVFSTVTVARKERFKARQSRMYLWVDLAGKRGWGLQHPRMSGIRAAAARVDPWWRPRFLVKRWLYRRRNPGEKSA